MESIVGPIVDKALETVLKKIEDGKKLSVGDLVVLMIGMFRETNRRVDALNAKIDVKINDVYRRIDEILKLMGYMEECINKRMDSLSARINDIDKSLNAKIDDVSRALGARIDAITGKIKDVGRRVEDTNRRIDETNKRIDILLGIMTKSSDQGENENK